MSRGMRFAVTHLESYETSIQPQAAKQYHRSQGALWHHCVVASANLTTEQHAKQ